MTAGVDGAVSIRLIRSFWLRPTLPVLTRTPGASPHVPHEAPETLVQLLPCVVEEAGQLRTT